MRSSVVPTFASQLIGRESVGLALLLGQFAPLGAGTDCGLP